MNYYLSINGQTIGPMTAQQVFAYNPNANTIVSTDGVNWQPLVVYPELMQLLSKDQKTTTDKDVSNKKVLVGIMAILFGELGVHYFLIGKTGAGLVTILITLVTCGGWWLVPLIQGIMILCMSDDDFKRRYLDSDSFMPF